MTVRDAEPVGHVLWRIGRYPDPLAWPPREFAGGGRFDDPERRFRVLYLAEHRLASFLESLARFRPALSLLAELAQLRAGDAGSDTTPVGEIERDWLATRRIGWLQPAPGLRLMDLRKVETRASLRVTLAPLLHGRGYHDFDMSVALNQDRALSQRVSRWAYEQGFRGIIYPSRFGAEFDCWVIHGGEEASSDALPFTPLGVAPIMRDDPDLLSAVRLFRLNW